MSYMWPTAIAARLCSLILIGVTALGMGAMNNYRGKRRAQLYQLPPHCYAVAEEAYQLLAKTGVNQVRHASLCCRWCAQT